MPWKNNRGSTLQIDIEKSEKYLWRLSAATIISESSFSEFNGYDRLLTIWQGEGLLLNDFELLQNQIFKFKGEDQIICNPINGEVIDLGFIYDRKNIKADMKILNIDQNKELVFDSELTFLFCLQGEFQVDNLIIHQGDTLKIKDAQSISFRIRSEYVRLVQILINLIHLDSKGTT